MKLAKLAGMLRLAADAAWNHRAITLSAKLVRASSIFPTRISTFFARNFSFCFGIVLFAEAATAFWFSADAANSGLPMKGAVLLSVGQDEIHNGIIRANMVIMVDQFASKQWPFKMLGHYETVFQNVSAGLSIRMIGSKNLNISILNKFLALGSVRHQGIV